MKEAYLENPIRKVRAHQSYHNIISTKNRIELESAQLYIIHIFHLTLFWINGKDVGKSESEGRGADIIGVGLTSPLGR